MRGHVAGAAGIAVVAPGAAEIAGLLEDPESGVPSLLERDGHAQTREAGAHDRDVQFRLAVKRCIHKSGPLASCF